ncbi:HEAT repeat domain-containing protein [Armatimonas rosea]|uniref:Knr4/Smi1-like domain-containing protein n=1 Tax=Armatimonas rosea TaxID=685828 RepID=A0A7W9SMS2_ARMRO|nr:HEAT repeat domain-containing protein [Armatimonas rosea]MBB6049492.1 hypothetical protein [Armatimonas rosea]
MITELISWLREKGAPLHPGATDQELAQLTEALGAPLPDDIVALYRDHNGMGEWLYSEEEEDEHEADEGYGGQFFRLMTIAEVLDVGNFIYDDLAFSVALRACIPDRWGCFWTDDESNHLFLWLDGPLQGRVGLLMHADTCYPVLFRSLESFLRAQKRAGHRGFAYGALTGDYPPQQTTASPVEEQGVVAQLQLLLQDETDSDERLMASRLICLLLPWEQSAELIPLLDDRDFYVAEDAAESLGKRRYGPAVEALRRAILAKRPNVPSAAAKALCQIATPEAIEAIFASPAGYFRSASDPWRVAEAMIEAGYRFRPGSPKPEYCAPSSDTWHPFTFPCPNKILYPERFQDAS